MAQLGNSANSTSALQFGYGFLGSTPTILNAHSTERPPRLALGKGVTGLTQHAESNRISRRAAPLGATARLSRRWLLALSIAGATVVALRHGVDSASAAGSAVDQAPAGATLPVSGPPSPELTSFDELMLDVMGRWKLQGGTLALAKDGRLVFSHAYGWADPQANQPYQPTSLCRIASDSKPVTAMATLRLLDQGKLSLDDKPFRILSDLQPPANATIDPRLDLITIQNLLQHTGGWDSQQSFDPQYQPQTFWEAGVLGVSAPPSAEDIIRFMFSIPLDFDPGTKYAYSNFGYNVLGRIIERVSGLSYGDAVQQLMLAPSGITDMFLGRTSLEDRAAGEVRYISLPDQVPVTSIFPGVGYVPNAYGGYFMEALDSHGGWVATAEDQIRFATAVDGQRGSALLQPQTVDKMLHTPVPQASGSEGAGNGAPLSGLGWGVRGDGSWSHTGALEGSCASWIVRRTDGVAISFIFNSLPTDYGGFFGDIIPALTKAADEVQAWPAYNLFQSKEAPFTTAGLKGDSD
jgi:N-acyl-D-amino-acid deacylase